MSRRFWPWPLAVALVPSGAVVTATAAEPAAVRAAGVFDMTTVHDFHLEFTAAEWEKMQAVVGGFGGFGGFGAPRPAPKPAEPGERHKSAGFGLEFPWAKGALTAGGQTYRDLGIRYKGNGSYLPSAGRLKRNLKIDFDHYGGTERFRGLDTLNLNAGAADPTRYHEALAYAVYRAAGVPAPRTAFATVTLTVPGKYDREFVGLYTLVEQVDKGFLAGHFKDGKGLLLKPERPPGAPGGPQRVAFDYLGDDWEKYTDVCNPKRDPTPAQAKRVIEFARLIHRADAAEFRAGVGAYLDVEKFLRFLAATALVVNTDSFFTLGHNAYVYLDPATEKFVFLPWDLDLSFGGFFLYGPPDQQAEMSLTHPYPGEHKLTDRLLAIPEVAAKYQAILKELAAGAFARDRLLKDLAAVEAATKDAVAREAKATAARKEGAGFAFGFGPPQDLKKFIAQRTDSVAAQLAGKSKGTVPAVAFGGFGARPARPGEVLGPQVQNQLRLTDAQKKELAALQKEVDERLDKMLTEEQRAQLRRLRGGPGGPPGPGRP